MPLVLNYFPDLATEDQVARELEIRRRQTRAQVSRVSPQTALSLATLSREYPTLGPGVLVGAALAGLMPGDPSLKQIANRSLLADVQAQRQVEAAAQQPGNRPWDQAWNLFQGGVRVLTTALDALYKEATVGTSSFVVGLTQGLSPGESASRSYGMSPGAIALASALQGREVNLGSGLTYDQQELTPELQEALAAIGGMGGLRDMPAEQAQQLLALAQSPAQLEKGLPAWLYGELLRQSQGVRIGARGEEPGRPVTPGRWLADTIGTGARQFGVEILEPGSGAYNALSGLGDLTTNIALDPGSALLKLGGALRGANRALVPDAVRPTVLERNANQWLNSPHGQAVTRHLAQERDYQNVYGMLRHSTSGRRVNATLARDLTNATHPGEVARILHEAVQVGALERVVAPQSLAGRAISGATGLPVGSVTGTVAGALTGSPRAARLGGVGVGVAAAPSGTVLGQWARRLSTNVYENQLDPYNVDSAVENLGSFLRIAQFDHASASRYMHRMASIEQGDIHMAYRIMTDAASEWSTRLVAAGLAPEKVRPVAEIFSEVEELRKYFTNLAGNPEYVPTGRVVYRRSGEIDIQPSAVLFSEMLNRTIPLPDPHKVRSAMRQVRLAETFSPRVAAALMDTKPAEFGRAAAMVGNWTMSQAWKPLVLFRVAYMVRILLEEQIRMAAAGLDSFVHHPVQYMAMLMGRKEGLVDDLVTGAAEHRAAMTSGNTYQALLGESGRRRTEPFEYITYIKGESPQHLSSWVGELSQLWSDELASAIARSVYPLVDEVPPGAAGGLYGFGPEPMLGPGPRALGRGTEEPLAGDVDRIREAMGRTWQESAADPDPEFWFHGAKSRHDRLTQGWFTKEYGSAKGFGSVVYVITREQAAGLGRAADSGAPMIRRGQSIVPHATIDTADDTIRLGGGPPAGGSGPASPPPGVTDDLPPFYHGSSAPLPPSLGALGEAGRSSENLFGPAFYSTASDAVARTPGYGGRPGGAVTPLRWTGTAPPRILDLEAAGPESLRAAVREVLDPVDGPEDLWDELVALLDDAGATGESIYGAARRFLGEAGITRAEADEILLAINTRLARDFDAMRHTGGRRSGSDPHEVMAWLHPEHLSDAGPPAVIGGDSAGGFGGALPAERAPFVFTSEELLDDVKRRFWDGDLASVRERLIKDHPELREGLSRRDVADAHIEMIWARINSKTGGRYRVFSPRIGGWQDDIGTQISDLAPPPGNRDSYVVLEPGDPDIIRAIGQGRLDDIDLVDADEATYKRIIATLGQENYYRAAPDKVKGPREIERTMMDAWDKMIRTGFHLLIGVETDKLSRSPTWRQFYWKRVGQALPMADEATRNAMLIRAKEAGVPRKQMREWVGRAMEPATDAAFDSLESIDTWAKAFALEETQRLLYDLSRRRDFFQMTRLIFPFGEAWNEIISTWGKMLVEHPEILRRGTQALQGARSSGFFYTDPSTNEEVFNYPGSKFLAEHMFDGAVTPQLTGRVAGLNLALGSIMPGFGPIVQLPAAQLDWLTQDPDFRWLRDQVFPFSTPDAETPGEMLDSLMPTWFRRAMQALGRSTGTDQRLYNNTIIDVMRAMKLAGQWRDGTKDEYDASMATAKERAKQLFVIRTFSSFAAPTGASVRWDVNLDPDGTAYAYQVLATEYRKLIEANPGDDAAAFDQFVQRFGIDPLVLAEPKSQSIVPRSVTEEGYAFYADNQALFKRFPLTAYFAMPDDPDAAFDYGAYLEQFEIQIGVGLDSPARVPLTPGQWLDQYNRAAGGMIYERAKQAVGDNPNDEQRAWLRVIREQVRQAYPGFGGETIGLGQAVTQDQMIEELAGWSADPFLSKTETGQGLIVYLGARDAVIAEAANRGVVGWDVADGTADLRSWLASVAQFTIMQYPDFAAVFDRVLSNEVEVVEPVAPTSLAGIDLTGGE